MADKDKESDKLIIQYCMVYCTVLFGDSGRLTKFRSKFEAHLSGLALQVPAPVKVHLAGFMPRSRVRSSPGVGFRSVFQVH